MCVLKTVMINEWITYVLTLDSLIVGSMAKKIENFPGSKRCMSLCE